MKTSQATGRLILWSAATHWLLACSPADTADGNPTSNGGNGGVAAGAAGAPSAGATSGGGGASSGAAGATSGGAMTGGGGATAGGAGATSGGNTTSGAAGQGGAAMGGSAGMAGSSGTAGATNALCPPNAQLCLDFESGAFPGWNKKESGGTLTVDQTRAYHGTRALLVSVPAGKAGGLLENHGAPLFPLPQNQLWGRMMVYFDGVPDGHTDLARGTGANGGPNYNVGEQHDSIMLNYYAGSQATDCWARPKPEKKVPDKTWMCWEWRFDSANNAMDFWLDGALLRSVDETGDGCLTGNGVWQAPASFGSISVGEQIAEISSSTAYKTWIDDVAISNEGRVGCPPAP